MKSSGTATRLFFVVAVFRFGGMFVQNAAGRLRNFLTKENKSPGFPIRIQLLDVRSMDYQSTRRGRRLEWCVSLKVRAG